MIRRPPQARGIPATTEARRSGGRGRLSLLVWNPGHNRSRCGSSSRLGVGPPRHILGPCITLGPSVTLSPGIGLGPRIALIPAIPLRPRQAIPWERSSPARATVEVHDVVVTIRVLVGRAAEVPGTGQIGVDIEP